MFKLSVVIHLVLLLLVVVLVHVCNNILFRALGAAVHTCCNHHDELEFSVPFLTQESSIFLQQNYHGLRGSFLSDTFFLDVSPPGILN
jgi:hypothetical protein